jgi:hypothetical protein
MTFVLDASIQGIADAQDAENIARGILAAGDRSRSDDIGIVVIPMDARS